MSLPSPLLRVRKAPRGVGGSIIISVSRKEAPRAVTRNRIRRRIRAAIKNAEVSPVQSVILVANARVAAAPFKEITEEVKKLLRNHE